MSLFAGWRKMDKFEEEENPVGALLRRPVGCLESGQSGATGMEIVV